MGGISVTRQRGRLVDWVPIIHAQDFVALYSEKSSGFAAFYSVVEPFHITVWLSLVATLAILYGCMWKLWPRFLSHDEAKKTFTFSKVRKKRVKSFGNIRVDFLCWHVLFSNVNEQYCFLAFKVI